MNKIKEYLTKEDFNISNTILVAPTGAGKTTALKAMLNDTNQQAVIVSPLNALSKQISEDSNLFNIVNSEQSNDIESELDFTLRVGDCPIISLQTLDKYSSKLKNYPVFIDEAHLLISFNELANTDSIIDKIQNNYFSNINLMTATPMGLSELFENLNIVEPKIKSKYERYIELIETNGANSVFANKLSVILSLYKANKKIVCMINNTALIGRLKNELVARGLNVKIFTSKEKEIGVVNERFTEDFDIVLATSSLTTGVSIRDDFYSVYFMEAHDSINDIPQFFARNRNTQTGGAIVKNSFRTTREDGSFVGICKEFKILNDYVGKTEANISKVAYINKFLQNIKYNINKSSLQYILGDNYIIADNVLTHTDEAELLVEQVFEQKIDDQEEYFIKNLQPMFNRAKYPNLSNLYDLYDFIFEGIEFDKDTTEGFKSIVRDNEFQFNRSYRKEFYNCYIEQINGFKSLLAILLASKTTSETINVDEFKELFLDKPYKKKEVKEYCVRVFAVEQSIFKNADSISEFLGKLGFKMVKNKGVHIIRLAD